VKWGDLRRLTPFSRVFGFDRGTPVDRYYIDRFLERCAQDIRGRVLEIGDPSYTHRFGGTRVAKSDVMHATQGNALATFVGDLATGAGIPERVFDCVILTQTLPFIYSVHSAVATVWKALTPGGVVIATVPGISQISRYDMERWGDYWRFTDASARRMFGDVFGDANVEIAVFGNVLAASAFLHGLAAHELEQDELDAVDSDYQVIIGVRATKHDPEQSS
jgi:hypothetical protein